MNRAFQAPNADVRADEPQNNVQPSGYRTVKNERNLGWLVLSCALITLIVCVFSWAATFGLLPRRAHASSESMLAADYSPWEGYQVLNLDVVRLATAAAQGDAPWMVDDGVAVAEVTLPPATAIEITSQATPLPTLTPTLVPPTRRPRLPGPTNTPLPTSTATAVPTSPPPAPTSPPPAPTSPPAATNTPVPTPSDTPTATNSPTPTDTPTATATETLTPTPTETPTLTPTPTQIPLPPNVELSEPPDNNVYEFCNTPVIIDLYDHPITVPGSSLRFYEHWNVNASPPPAGWMYLDFIQIEICADGGCSTPAPMFRWGDSNPGNNGSLPATYGPTEDAAEPFSGPKVGISISIGGMPAGIYQFVRLSTPGSDCGTDSSHNAQVDALIVTP